MSGGCAVEFIPTCYVRKNYSAPMYCDIAMEAYYDAQTMFTSLKDANYNTDDAKGKPNSDFFHLYPRRIEKKIAITIIFAELAAESFINDYLAAYYGDEKFVELFDKSSIYGKLEKLIKDIFDLKSTQNLPWFIGFRDMVVRRNAFVHNVSSDVSVDEFLWLVHGKDKESYEAAIQRVEALKKDNPYNLNDQYKAAMLTEQEAEENLEYLNSKTRYSYITNQHRKYLESELTEARLSLQALCDMMRYFEEKDPQSYAFHSLFSPGSLLLGEDDEKAIRQVVFPAIGLPIQMETAVKEPVKISSPKAIPKSNTKNGSNKGKHKEKNKNKHKTR